MSAFVWAVAVGVLVFTWARGEAWWPQAAGWGLGLWAHDRTLMVVGMVDGTVVSYYLRMRRYAEDRSRDQAWALLFLVRLEQLLSITGNLASAIEEMGYRPVEPTETMAEHVLGRIAEAYRVKPLTFVSEAALFVRRCGGKLEPLVAWAKETIQANQVAHQKERLEHMARESTMVTLALAPLGVLVLFRLAIPSFFRVLCDTRLGDGTLALVGATTALVFGVLSGYQRKEAEDV
ncbi:MAG: hypothetical protein OWU84_07035 [Firmicutes bacterium]|nr:hypothetical protein [Bacillota bacterium]